MADRMLPDKDAALVGAHGRLPDRVR